MKSVSVDLWECTKEDARNLPKGFPFLEYDTLYGRIRTMTAGKNRVRRDGRYVYLCYKNPFACDGAENSENGIT